MYVKLVIDEPGEFMTYLLQYGAVALELLMAVLMTGAARYYGRDAWKKRHWRRLWTATVFTVVAVAAVSMGVSFALFPHLPVPYTLAALFATAGAMWLMVTIPCGIPFFNRRYIRPFRNLVFLGLGGWYFYVAWYWLRIWQTYN